MLIQNLCTYSVTKFYILCECACFGVNTFQIPICSQIQTINIVESEPIHRGNRSIMYSCRTGSSISEAEILKRNAEVEIEIYSRTNNCLLDHFLWFKIIFQENIESYMLPHSSLLQTDMKLWLLSFKTLLFTFFYKCYSDICSFNITLIRRAYKSGLYSRLIDN